MALFTTLFLFVLGFYVLVKGAQILVRGAVSVARIFNISSWVVGVVIVGIGTSIPEFAIILASVFEETTVGLGAIIGSSTFNLLVILGIAALVTPLAMRKEWVYRDLPINIGATLLGAIFILYPVLGDSSFVGISRLEAFVLLSLFFVWIIFMLTRGSMPDEELEQQVYTGFISILLIVVGVIGVFFGGQWVVDGAEAIAVLLGASPALIGLTIVAVGTSVPELAVTIVALTKRQFGVAVGNIIGSNIFNFLGIFGITALIHPIAVAGVVRFDMLVALGASLMLLIMLLIGRGYKLSRIEGTILLSSYLLYIVIIVMRG